MVRLFNDLHTPFSLFHTLPREAFEPREPAPVAVRDADGAYELSLDLPGVSQKDVDITLEGALLSLVARRTFKLADGTEEVRTLTRRFKLPTKGDADKTTAALKDGVLTVRVAKFEAPAVQKIAVT
ncbi:MAG: Hsp20/alpha crystallin family protein [Polyangiaceae bacterium]|nr:Hsp20/alpha crystallin family protein [Polyangiaceae bacterium]